MRIFFNSWSFLSFVLCANIAAICPTARTFFRGNCGDLRPEGLFGEPSSDAKPASLPSDDLLHVTPSQTSGCGGGFSNGLFEGHVAWLPPMVIVLFSCLAAGSLSIIFFALLFSFMPKRLGELGMSGIPVGLPRPPVAMGVGLDLPGDPLADANVGGDFGESGGEGPPAFGLAEGEDRELEGEPAEKMSSGDLSFVEAGSSASCPKIWESSA